MSARIEVQAPSTVRPGNMAWIAAALALLVAAGALVWTLTRSSGPTAVPHPQPGVTTVTDQDSGGPGLVDTGGVTRPVPYGPVAPAVAPHAPAAPAPPAAEAAQAEGGWYFHMVSTGGVAHPAPSS